MPFIEHTAETLLEYLKLVPQQEYGNLKWVYRGHESSEYKLVPSLFRSMSAHHNSWQLLERALLNRFFKAAVPYVGGKSMGILDKLALAQHHGLPTRLLDWSFNPLAALFFAVENDEWTLTYGGEPNSEVWFSRMKWFGEYQWSEMAEDLLELGSVEESRIYVPHQVSPRIGAQNGCFSIHPIPTSARAFKALEEDAAFPFELKKVIIPNGCRPKIKAELNTIGVNHASLFPGLDGIAKQVRWEELGEKHAEGFIGSFAALQKVSVPPSKPEEKMPIIIQ